MSIDLRVNCLSVWPIKKHSKSQTIFSKKAQYQCPRKFILSESRSAMRTERRTDGQTGTKKLMHAFRNFVNAPKKSSSLVMARQEYSLSHQANTPSSQRPRLLVFRKSKRFSVSEHRSLFTVVTQISRLSNICNKLENKKGKLHHSAFNYVTRLQQPQTNSNVE